MGRASGLLATLVVPLAGQALPRWYVAPPVIVTASVPEGAFAETLPVAPVVPSGGAAALDLDTVALLLWPVRRLCCCWSRQTRC